MCPCTQSAQPGINIFETKMQSKGFIRRLLRNLWHLFNHAFNGKWEKKWFIKKNVLLQNSLFYAINNCLILSFPSCVVAAWHPCQFTVRLCLRWWAPLFALVQLQLTTNGSWQHSFNRKLLSYWCSADSCCDNNIFFPSNCFHVRLIRWHASWHKEGMQRHMRHSFLVLLVLTNVYAQTGLISSYPTKLG